MAHSPHRGFTMILIQEPRAAILGQALQIIDRKVGLLLPLSEGCAQRSSIAILHTTLGESQALVGLLNKT